MLESAMLQVPARYWRAAAGDDQPAGFVTETLSIEIERTALLLVDVYCNDQESEPSSISGALARLWDDAVARLALACRAARGMGMPVIYATNSAPRIALQRSEFGLHFQRSWHRDFNRAFAEGGLDPREYHGGRSGMLAFPPGLEPEEGDFYIRKHTYSGFFDTRLDTALRNLGIRNLICGGFWADVCLLATSLDAFYRNYRVIWLRDGTLAGEDAGQEYTLAFTQRMLRWFETLIGWSIASADFVESSRTLAASGRRNEEFVGGEKWQRTVSGT